ncbi:MAG: AAA family ATPase, partial [Anaerolineales bacterium]|nr:AAA family ATPase [Anaerolineales bacterium]
MPRYTITLLGSSQVRLPDQTLVRLEGKTGILFAYLATEAGRVHARQTLAELFWPERTHAQALSSLRFAFSNLRSLLQDQQESQPVLLVDRSQVQINPQAEVWVDVTAFEEQALAFETQANAGSSPAVTELQAALALYQGSFLPNIQWGDSLELETWILSKREQLERHHLRLLYFLGAGLESTGNFSQAEEAYHRILVIQPWNENAHQRLMHLLASTGQYSAALAQYENYRLVLSEFDIEPGRETNLLYHHIKKEQAASHQVEATFPDALDQQSPPFVARERELDRLDAFLGQALAGQGQVVLITGEAGSGKSALLQEFAKQALACHPGLIVVGGRCNAYAGLGQPYQPLIEIVQMLAGSNGPLPWIDQLPAENTERLKRSISPIIGLLVEKSPDLFDRFINRADLTQFLQDMKTTDQLRPNWEKAIERRSTERSRQGHLGTAILFEQMTRLLAEISHHAPLLLLLDDMQWVDPGSAALLFHLARRTATCRILILVTYRPGEVHASLGSDEHPLLGVVTELQRYTGNIRLDLDQIDERTFTAAFIKRDPLLQPNELGGSFCATLARRTAGNPLFTIELLRSLQARGDLQRREDGKWVP